MNTKNLMKKAVGASTGIAVAAAFFNVALLLVELVKTVSADEDILAELDAASLEDTYVDDTYVTEND